MKIKLSNIFLLFFSIFIALALVEIILRLFFPVYLAGHIGIYQYDDKLAIRLKDNLHAVNVTDYRQEIKTNHYGTVNFQESFKGYKKLVFAVGDSYTQGTGIPMDTNYPFQMNLMLNMDNGKFQKKYGIVNLGLAAYGMEQEILAVKKYEKKIGVPDYILFLGCPNDYDDDVLFLSGYRFKHMVEGSPFWGIFVKPAQFLTNDLEIGKRLKLAIGEYRRLRLFKNDNNTTADNTDSSVEEVAKQEMARFDRLADLASKMGAKLIVSWTDVPSKSSGSYLWLKKWAAEKNVEFADWAPMVKSVEANIPGLPVSNDHSGGHYRVWVNTMVARAFAEAIRRQEKQ